jgi:hypothetical protein
VAQGGIFRREWLKRYGGQPDYQRIIFSLDTALKTGEANDYSVIEVLGGPRLDIISWKWCANGWTSPALRVAW